MSFEKPAGSSGPGNIYPLAALVGQDRMKLALLLLVVDPRLGGVLLVGEKGTAKSTAVRALTELTPLLTAVKDCLYNCDPDRPDDFCPDCRRRFKLEKTLPCVTRPTPFLTLPLGATEDRLAGGLNLELTARTGRPELSVGLLGQTNRGFLYVDEINLLEPYLGHLLLDAAESGRVRVEREGISLRHPARIALIGTMNPEEGSLGPQLADRFALTVRVIGEADPDVRAGIVRRRLAFETDPAGFRGSWAKETKALGQRLTKARRRLSGIEITPQAQSLISALVREHRSKGHRGDLALARAARALAAWQDAPVAGEKQVLAMADLALASRRTGERKTRVKAAPVRSLTPPPNKPFEEPYIPPSEPEFVPTVPGEPESDHPQVLRLFVPNEKFEVVTPANRREQGPRERTGHRAARQTSVPRGRYFRSSPERLGRPLALDATFRAAAPHQSSRRASKSSALVICKHDFREKVFRQKTGRLVLFPWLCPE
ncbi:MAG: ATP-binding protein [Thermodesulfobacteriota bacterium]|nr:ATP-binding protein [Thermodesulfobacteriota bacterium]